MRCGVLVLATLAAIRATTADVHRYWTADEDGDRGSPPHRPVLSSYGFYLIGNATGPGCQGTEELVKMVHGHILQGYHTGSGDAAAILHGPRNENMGLVFYLHGPTVGPGSKVIFTESGRHHSVYGLVMPERKDDPSDFGDEEALEKGIQPSFPDPYHDRVSLEVRTGTPVRMDNVIGVINMESNGTFIACHRALPYSDGTFVFTVHYLHANDKGDNVPNRCANGVTPAHAPPGIPDDCVPIRLLAMCTNRKPTMAHKHPSDTSLYPVKCLNILRIEEKYQKSKHFGQRPKPELEPEHFV